jgi:hypothetical protein
MEKYGVVEHARNSTKLGGVGPTVCPKCGTALSKHGAIVLCPIHGSEPFEHAATEQTK